MPCLTTFRGHPLIRLPAANCSSPDILLAAHALLLQAGRGATRVVVDLSQVRLVQGAILGMLVSAYSRMGARPGDLAICAPDPVQREVFRIVGLDRVFPICASRDEAIGAAWPAPVPILR